MKALDPNVAKVEQIAGALGHLREQLVFVGGCAAGLLLTDAAAASARVTYDVDLLAAVVALLDYYKLEEEFAQLGFKRDISQDAPICRWRYGDLEVDLMPMDSRVLGFSNRWYPHAVETAQPCILPSGRKILLISATAFLATKFEAFADRGASDMLGSHDLEDIMNIVDGRPELIDEVSAARIDLRAYLAEQCATLMQATSFVDALPGLIFPDENHAARVSMLTQRLGRIASLHGGA